MIKTLYSNLSSIVHATTESFFKHFKPSKHVFCLFSGRSNLLCDVIMGLVRSTQPFASTNHDIIISFENYILKNWLSKKFICDLISQLILKDIVSNHGYSKAISIAHDIYIHYSCSYEKNLTLLFVV